MVTLKRNFLGWNCIIWPIRRQNRPTCGWFREGEKTKHNTKAATWSYCRGETPAVIAMNFVPLRGLTDIISCAKYDLDWPRCFQTPDPWKTTSPVGNVYHKYNNALRYCAGKRLKFFAWTSTIESLQRISVSSKVKLYTGYHTLVWCRNFDHGLALVCLVGSRLKTIVKTTVSMQSHNNNIHSNWQTLLTIYVWICKPPTPILMVQQEKLQCFPEGVSP